MLQSRIRRGELDRQIVIVKKTVGSNTTNEDELTGWEKIDNDPQVWAKLEQRPGREVVVADEIQTTMNTIFTIDYRTDLNATMRIIYGTKYFHIVGIAESSRESFLVISTDEVPNETPTITIE